MLSLQDLSKQYGPKRLFEKVTAHVSYRSRVALIGPNGSGKSTLIKIILGTEEADSGSVRHPKQLAIGHLAQEVPKFSDLTVLEEVMRLDGRREKLLATKAELEILLSEGKSEFQDDLEHYGRIIEELELLDEYRLESRAKAICLGMGFKEHEFCKPLRELSGGWLMRVALSRLLLMEPDLLLLDEPTNHLDLESLLWLEDFLRSYRGAMLLVSHDTEFLNRLCSEVWEIDQNKLNIYRGNIVSYARQKEERLNVLRAQYEGQQTKIAAIESFVKRFGAKATKARQAQSRLKQLDKMEIMDEPDAHRATVRFRFPPTPHSGKQVVTVKNASMSYGDKIVFKDINWVIPRNSRVAVVGVNGVGKTTLLKLLAGELQPTSGDVIHGYQVIPGYFAQHQSESLDLKKTVLEELEAVAPHMPISQVRAIAGAFLFTGDAVEKKCAVLSGGEKARIALAKLLLSPTNFLILDEPTNHLDVESRAVLLEALQDYTGTLCMVSHDRSFISPLVNSVLEILPSAGGSQVVKLVGDYESYLERKMREMADNSKKTVSQALETGTEVKKPRSVDNSPKGPSFNKRRSWEREREAIENGISLLETRQKEIHVILADPLAYDDQKRLRALIAELNEIEKDILVKMSRWEELGEMLSAV